MKKGRDEEFDDEREAQFEGEFYRWTCPKCDEVNEEPIDPRGNEVECGFCAWLGDCES